jgi:hypothetical protein
MAESQATDDWMRRFGEFWRRDCQTSRGRLLTGTGRHWCLAHDGLPTDDTCLEWPCDCVAKGHVGAEVSGA